MLLAGVYDSLPAELPVFRNPVAGVATLAPKSAFTAFRVPLMNLTHGLMAGVMLSHATDFGDETRRASYSVLFSTLLFAIALKSLCEALEVSSLSLRLGPLLVVFVKLSMPRTAQRRMKRTSDERRMYGARLQAKAEEHWRREPVVKFGLDTAGNSDWSLP